MITSSENSFDIENWLYLEEQHEYIAQQTDLSRSKSIVVGKIKAGLSEISKHSANRSFCKKKQVRFTVDENFEKGVLSHTPWSHY